MASLLLFNSPEEILSNGLKQRPKIQDADTLVLSFGELIDIEEFEGKYKAYFLLLSVGLGRVALPKEVLNNPAYSKGQKPYSDKFSVSPTFARSLLQNIGQEYWIAFNQQATSSTIKGNQITFDKTRLIAASQGLESLKDLLVGLEIVKASSSYSGSSSVPNSVVK